MPRKKVEYDFSPNSLFRAGNNYGLNARVGNNGGPYSLASYGKGFFDGGQIIVEAARRSREYPIDLIVYPAAFNFRHGIELYLKHLLQILVWFNGSDIVYGKNHSIEKYWELFKVEAGKVKEEAFDPKAIQMADLIIKFFNQIDPTGQVFRYPEDIEGTRHLVGLDLINLDILGRGMTVMHDILKDFHFSAEYLCDTKRNYEAELNNY